MFQKVRKTLVEDLKWIEYRPTPIMHLTPPLLSLQYINENLELFSTDQKAIFHGVMDFGSLKRLV